MTIQDCSHGQHDYHHHHHLNVAEGMTTAYAKKLQWVLGLSVFYLMAQVAGSYISGSLALLAEAGHKLADIGAIALALFAAWFSQLSTSPQKTFGYHRVEILAALINGMALFAMAIFILYEAFERMAGDGHPHVEGESMLFVAGMGLVINLIAAWILFPAREHNLNVKGALFHVMADILGSSGTIITALGIMFFQLMWLDTAISIVIAGLVLFSAARVLHEAVTILLEAAPRHLDVSGIQAFLSGQPGVTDVHDLHVWSITTNKDALLAHVRVDAGAFSHETVLALENSLREQFNLCHITLQIEPPGFEEDEILF